VWLEVEEEMALLVEGWAMTETGTYVCITANKEPRHIGTRCIGRAPDVIEYRLVDEEGNDAGAGEPSELLIRARGDRKERPWPANPNHAAGSPAEHALKRQRPAAVPAPGRFGCTSHNAAISTRGCNIYALAWLTPRGQTRKNPTRYFVMALPRSTIYR